MLIEAASTRLNIDLLYSLKKNGFISSQIRLSYLYDKGIITYTTIDSLEELLVIYKDKYTRIIAARRDPFTTDKSQAFNGKIAEYGQVLVQEEEGIKISEIEGLCKVGPFCRIESMELVNSVMGYDFIYNCKNVSDNFYILFGKEIDIRKDDKRNSYIDKFKKRIEKFIIDYQTIQKELYKSWNANLYVDLCYSKIGYVEESMNLYKIYFPLVKERIDVGLRLSVLEPRFLKIR